SAEPAASSLPSAAKASAAAPPLWPGGGFRGTRRTAPCGPGPRVTSHNRRGQPTPAAARGLPSRANARVYAWSVLTASRRRPARPHVPEAEGPIFAGQGRERPVRGEGQGGGVARPGRQRVLHLARGCLQQVDLAAPHRQRLAVGGELHHPPERGAVRLQLEPP